MRITKIDCHVLLDPGYERDATSSAQDDIVVEIHTDEGITGIGETDLNAWVARACIEAPGTHTMDLGLGEMVLHRLKARPTFDEVEPAGFDRVLAQGEELAARFLARVRNQLAHFPRKDAPIRCCR